MGGHYIVGCDWKRNEHMPEDMFCDEFHLVDLRVYDNCMKVVKGCDHVFNLAADMGGMGFIQSNHSVILYNNIMISFNVLEASRVHGIKRCFYASSACIYPEFKQLNEEVEGGGLKESDAWPAQPQDAYGLEKLVPRRRTSTTRRTSTCSAASDASTTSTGRSERGRVDARRLPRLSAARPSRRPPRWKCGATVSRRDRSRSSTTAWKASYASPRATSPS